MLAAIVTRIEAHVPELAGRVRGAAELAALMRDNQLPQQTPAAHVLPLGLQGGRGESGAGLYTQVVEEAIGVVLTFRALGAEATAALAGVREIVRGVIAAIAGWGPDDMPGVFRLVRGGIVRMAGGTLVYQLDFAITDQLRINP